MTGPFLRAGAAAFLLAFWASGAPVAPHRSATELVSSNGHAVLGYDVTQGRVSSFLEHPYRTTSDGSVTRDLAFDVYPGLRIGTTGQWLTDITPESVAYEPGTGIIHVKRQLAGLSIDEYDFVPIDLEERALVSLIRVERSSGSPAAVDGYLLFNFHLGAGAPEPSATGETLAWDAGASAWLEWGGSGLTTAYAPIDTATHHGGSPENPFTTLTSGGNLADGNGTTTDDAVAGLQWSLGSLAIGEAAWFGGFVVLDSESNVLPRVAAVKSWINGRKADQLHADELAAWNGWHTPEPAGLSAKESALWSQQMAVLRMGQVSDGQILASLPPGNWNISWVRDMAYASVALSKSGHTQEAKRAIEFQLSADSGKYQDYVGHPYQISITRYFGDGVEETDFNEDGPNIEFDGFGLFLWELAEYVEASNDDASLVSFWPITSEKVADVLVALQEPNGLIAADSSIWEVHWNGKQKHFAYTTLTAANGLCHAAKLAERVGDSARAATYRAAGQKARDALFTQLSAPDGTLAQSLEDLAAGSGFLDAAAIAAVGFGLFDPKGRAANSTLASMKAKLVPASERGFMRNDDGGWYDSQEWVFVDLRAASVMGYAGDPDGASLVGWITDQGSENFGLISELHDATTADYAGEMPMVGFGAGAYALALLNRGSDIAPPCGEFADETSGSGGSGGSAGAAGAPHSASSKDEDGGCGCRTSRENGAGGAVLLFFLLLGRRKKMVRHSA